MKQKTEAHLSDLAFPEARFSCKIKEVSPGPRGIDSVEMLLAANPGLQATPLDKGASGGELSRVNLALLLASRAGQDTYIFDEVDSGIGGNTAHAVADKLKQLAESSQVIVVTHLAQIAHLADHHLLIEKEASKNNTAATIKTLNKKERQKEMARLIGADASSGEEVEKIIQRGRKK